jgi:hypothetical protein
VSDIVCTPYTLLLLAAYGCMCAAAIVPTKQEVLHQLCCILATRICCSWWQTTQLSEIIRFSAARTVQWMVRMAIQPAPLEACQQLTLCSLANQLAVIGNGVANKVSCRVSLEPNVKLASYWYHTRTRRHPFT